MGLLRLAKKDARKLSSELRAEDSDDLKRRRTVVSLSMLGTASLGLIALYQMGIIKHLPEPKLPYLNADEVDASAEAYQRFSMPDAVLGLGSYAATMGLASMGADDRARSQPYIPLALAAKVAYDAYNAGRLTVDQWTKHRSFCIWCLIAAAATFATVPLVIPEALKALRNLKTRSKESFLRKAA
jgi:hypothetical protein